MSAADTVAWTVALGAIGIAFLNPGGMVIGGGIALLVLGARYGLPFVGDLVRERQRGVGRAKMEQRARERVRDVNPRDDDRGRRR